MGKIAHIAALTLLGTAVLVSTAQASFCLFGCTDVDVSDRSYDLGNSYYVQEPEGAGTLLETQTYSIYRSGDYPGVADPAATFQLTNLHITCCDQPGLRRARQAVRLSMGDRHVDICTFRPDFSNYAVNLSVSLTGSSVAARLHFSADTCLNAGGIFNADVKRDLLGNVMSQSGPLVAGLEDVTSVEISEPISS